MRVLFVVFYSSIETVFLTQVEKLLGGKHFIVSAICSSAYIPPIVHLLPDAVKHIWGAHCPNHTVMATDTSRDVLIAQNT
jgi:hypothetical protein